MANIKFHKVDNLPTTPQNEDSGVYFVRDGTKFKYYVISSKTVFELDAVTAQDLEAGLTTIVAVVATKADASNVYTKTEVDAKVSSVYKIKGSVATVSALPPTGNTLGDVYNVTATGANYVWVGGSGGDLGNGWDSLGGTVDLTGYYTKTEANNAFEPKFSKNTAFNRNFGTAAGDVAQGNDSRFHTHANKSVLDGIGALQISQWNGKANDSEVVHLEGDETINGSKSFVKAVGCTEDAVTPDELVRLGQVEYMINNSLSWQSENW